MKNKRIIIFDTTLRDGEQCPGASMNLREKIEVARQLARLQVDVIEAGFPVISDGDFIAVQTIAKEIKGPIIAGLARCVPKDIEAAAAAVKPAGKRGRIHVFLATSKIHREFKLGKPQDEIIRLAVEGVKLARSFVENVEFSPEDGSRTEPEYLVQVCKAVIAAGATTINIPDTVGYAIPDQFGELIGRLYRDVPEFQSGQAVISVHCHNDLGLAVANSLAAVRGRRAPSRMHSEWHRRTGRQRLAGGSRHGDEDTTGLLRRLRVRCEHARDFAFVPPRFPA